MSKVLVVDDTPMDRCLIEGLLKKRDHTEVCGVADGAAALQLLSDDCFDLVVTDLTMPGMDGLQLTSQIRVKYPWIPVVIITAHGSELLAIQALEQGATSYVPKSHLGRKLLETVDHVLELACVSREQQRFASAMTRADFQFEFDNDATLFAPLIELVQQLLSSLNFCDTTEELRILMALEEGLRHTMYRGNLELSDREFADITDLKTPIPETLEVRRTQTPYRDRKLYVDVHLSTDEARFVVRHCGPSLTPTSTRDSQPQLESERALILMRSLLDDVSFDASGTVLTLFKCGPTLAGIYQEKNRDRTAARDRSTCS